MTVLSVKGAAVVPEPLSLQAALMLAADPDQRRRFSVFGAQPFLMVQEDDRRLDEADSQRLARWLQSLPCPTVYIGQRHDVVSGSCDVWLSSQDEARPVLQNICAQPLAATVLVQLLRTSAQLPLEQALVAESLAYACLQAGPEYRQWLAEQSPQAPVEAADTSPPVVMEREGNRLTLTLNRPATRNAISVEMRDALVEALQLAALDPSIERVLLRGRGRCFSIGGDLREFGSVPDPVTGHLVRSLTLPARALITCAERVECQVHGACIGAGVELPAFAHRLVAHPDSFFQLPELRFGLIPGAGGCVSVPRRIGRQRTAWLVLSGRRISARTALAWGLIDAVRR